MQFEQLEARYAPAGVIAIDFEIDLQLDDGNVLKFEHSGGVQDLNIDLKFGGEDEPLEAELTTAGKRLFLASSWGSRQVDINADDGTTRVDIQIDDRVEIDVQSADTAFEWDSALDESDIDARLQHNQDVFAPDITYTEDTLTADFEESTDTFNVDLAFDGELFSIETLDITNFTAQLQVTPREYILNTVTDEGTWNLGLVDDVFATEVDYGGLDLSFLYEPLS